MKKVLITLDYNPTAQKVAEMGYALAKAMKAEVILLHVIADTEYYSALKYGPIMGFPGYINSELVKIQAPKELKDSTFEFLNNSKKHLNDESIMTAVLEGNVPGTILKFAKEKHVDMIVMGTHSRRWLEKILIGSTTEEVLRDSDIPMFIVPTKEDEA